MPDAMRADGLALTATPSETLTIRPASSGRIEFQLRDQQGQPVPDYPIDFAILAENGDGGTVQARLSTDRGLTNSSGSAVLEVIADRLDPDSQAATFIVQATSQGAEAAARVEVMVTTNAYSVEIVPVAAADLIQMGTVVRTKLFFYDDATCGAIDLGGLATAPIRSRTPHDVDLGAYLVFLGVAGQGSHAVAGLGLDASNVVRIAGCLDLAGSSLLEDQTIIATLLLDHLLPVPIGNYLVASDITLPSPAPPAVAAIQAAWQEWSRCPLDPARLWLDCTIDSLVTNNANDPNDCIPIAGGEGALGGLLDARRGLTLQPVGTAGSKTTTTCRDRVDGNGKTSLEAIVDALFESSRSSIGAMNLGAFPNEIGALLSALHINSTMSITADKEPNNYLVDHDLVDITFPAPLASAPTITTTTLGLPMPYAHGVPANLEFGQIALQPHGFTLRLGTAAKYAFEDTSLQKSRNMAGATQLVNAIFAMATLSDQGDLLTGCDALDAALCDQIKESRGCLVGACRIGLAMLVQKLSDSFGNLDGDGLDFFLRGSAPVIDLDGDGRADALGMLRNPAGTVATGLWGVEIHSNLGTISVNGPWAAAKSSP